MGLSRRLLPLLPSLEESCPSRSSQLRQLVILYNVGQSYAPYRPTYKHRTKAKSLQDIHPPPRNLVIYGLQGTGKLHTLSSVLRARGLRFVVVRSRECVSLRHFLERVWAGCVGAVCSEGRGDGGEDGDGEGGGGEGAGEHYERRSDSVNALTVNLQRLLQGRWGEEGGIGKGSGSGSGRGRLVLVLDGVDRQRGMGLNTLPALARLGDVVC